MTTNEGTRLNDIERKRKALQTAKLAYDQSKRITANAKGVVEETLEALLAAIDEPTPTLFDRNPKPKGKP